MSIREDKKEETKDTSTPAAESVFMARQRATGGIDYSRQEQISQDEMTDELFAAFKRGDDQTVFGITTGTSKRPTSRVSAGAQVLAAQAQEMKFSKPATRSSKRRTFSDGGMMAALMAQTNGNEDLAQLLLAKLQSNTLMTMDGTYGDDMAREMGAYGLSENIRQVQRAEAVREDALEEQHIIGEKPENKSIWSAWFGPKEGKMDTIDIVAPTEPEKTPGMISKFACKFSKATGLSKVFGMFSNGDAEPVASQLLTLQAATTNFTQRLMMPAPRMF